MKEAELEKHSALVEKKGKQAAGAAANGDPAAASGNDDFVLGLIRVKGSSVHGGDRDTFEQALQQAVTETVLSDSSGGGELAECAFAGEIA